MEEPAYSQVLLVAWLTSSAFFASLWCCCLPHSLPSSCWRAGTRWSAASSLCAGLHSESPEFGRGSSSPHRPLHSSGASLTFNFHDRWLALGRLRRRGCRSRQGRRPQRALQGSPVVAHHIVLHESFLEELGEALLVRLGDLQLGRLEQVDSAVHCLLIQRPGRFTHVWVFQQKLLKRRATIGGAAQYT